MNSGKILIGLLAGAAAGAALGLLLAPDSGSDTVKKATDTFKKAAEKKEDYSEAIKEKIVNFLFSVIDKLTAGKEKTESAASAS